MTPEDEYLLQIKQANLLTGALMGANQLVSLPGLGQVGSMAMKGIARVIGAGHFDKAYGAAAANFAEKNLGKYVHETPHMASGGTWNPFKATGGTRADIANKLYTSADKLHGGVEWMNGHVNNFLNKGPGINYGKWLKNDAPGVVKKPLEWMGVNVHNDKQRMTAQRAAVWAGGGLALKETVAPTPQPQPQQTNIQPPEPMQPMNPGQPPQLKAAAVQQAQQDFAALRRYMEG